jgi:hypothetical protein
LANQTTAEDSRQAFDAANAQLFFVVDVTPFPTANFAFLFKL